MSMLEVKNLSLRLKDADILKDVSFSLPAGVLSVVIGPNGAGKSSLLKALMGLIKPASGQMQWGETDLMPLSPASRAAHMAYLPQERTIAWDLSAIEVAALGALNEPAAYARTRAMAALTTVGMDNLADAPVSRLSGGQRARVLLARLMVSDAPLWLLDEPLSALDPAWQRRVLTQLKARGSCLISLHDLDLAARFADHLILMHQGHVVAEGAAAVVLTQHNLAMVFELEGRFETDRLTIKGLSA
jgi:iron complex transport system ATP-binding protein